MSAKSIEGFPFSGIPKKIQMDNGPITKNRVFLRVMTYLGIEVITHLPRGADERKTAARGKSKVERPFRTIKEIYETLYHFHKPETEIEANRWLLNYLRKYNQQDHREKLHSRMEDWLINHPPAGIREMCQWERFSTFAREPEQRKVGIDTRISFDGIAYEVDPNLAGEEVTLWWGLFDSQLFVEFNDEKYGPYHPIGTLSSLPTYRRFKKTKYEERADQVSTLAKKLDLPRSAFDDQNWELTDFEDKTVFSNSISFSDPDPFQEFTYSNIVLAKRAIADYLGQPIMRLPTEERAFIDEILAQTLVKKTILERIDGYFQSLSLVKSLDLSIEEKENYVN